MARSSCHIGIRGVRRLARASRRYLNFGQRSRRWMPTQHHKQVVGRAQLEGPPSEALSHVHCTIQEDDDSLGYSWTFLWPLSTRGDNVPILQFRKTEIGKISCERTSSSYLARIGRSCGQKMDKILWQTPSTFDLLRSSHKLNSNNIVMWETQCSLGLFQDSDFAGDLEDSKSTSGGLLCIFGSHTFVPISWMCKKQTSDLHSSTEAEIMSLDACLRMDGSPALDLWDSVIEVFHSSPNQTNSTTPKVKYRETCRVIPHWTSTLTTKPEFQSSTTILICTMLTVCRRTRSCFDLVRCCTYLRITKPWLKWSSKVDVPQWHMYPEPTGLLLIGCFDRSNLDPKNSNQVCRHQTPICRHVDQRKYHSRSVEQSSSFV